MSVTIPFTAEIEAKLRERAAAMGKAVDIFVREAIEEKLAQPVVVEKSSTEWAKDFEAWMNDVAKRIPIPPADDSRESIYNGCGE